MNLHSYLLAGLAALFFATPALAETHDDVALLFGRTSAISQPQLSPDGRYLSTLCAPQVKRTVCVFDLTSGDAVVVPTLADTRLTGHYWASADTLILNVEIFQSIRTSSGMKDFVFERAVSYNLKTQKPLMLLKQQAGGYLYGSNLAAILPAEPGHILIGMMVERAAGFVYEALKVDLAKGNARTVSTSGLNHRGAIHKPSGEIAAEVYYALQPNTLHTLKLISGGRTLVEWKDLSFFPFDLWGLDAAGKALVVFFEEPDRHGLYRISLEDGALAEIDLPSLGGDGLIWPVLDQRSRQVAGFASYRDKLRQAFEDPALQVQYEELSAAFPEADVSLVSWTDDRSESVVSVEMPGLPVDYYIFSAASGELSPIGNSAPHLAGRTLGTVEEVRYLAADGLEIPGYLTLPPGKSRADGPFPLILMPHGGPESRDFPGFDWWAQAYSAAGYAVLQPNFRGSSGYGNAFRDAGYGEYGGKMVTDVLDGARWAVREGLAREGQVCAAGASYGGYSALMLGAIGGSEIGCVISVNGVTNPASFLGSATEGGFVYNYLVRYLGTDRYADAATRSEISPVRRINDIKAPILLIAGRQDMTVPYAQSEGFKSAAGKRTDVILVPMDGEDHYLNSTVSRHTVLAESLKFLARHLPAD